MNLLRKLINKFGGVLFSTEGARILYSQRDDAVGELVNYESAFLRSGLEGVVFSKDRALQLYTLLESYRTLVANPVNLTILYTASTEEHSKAYKEARKLLLKKCNFINFQEEKNGFKSSLVDILSKIKVKNIFFLVDDIIFIRNLDFSFVKTIDTSKYILSLRHSPSLRKSYTANRKQSPPNFAKYRESEELLEFNWFESGHEWSDPWSVDGQILSKAEVSVISKISKYSAPNSYEAAMKSFASLCEKKKGLCYTESKILNLPINRVQNETKNLSGSISPEYLLSQWNNGLMIETTKFSKHIPESTHEEHTIEFRKRT